MQSYASLCKAMLRYEWGSRIRSLDSQQLITNQTFIFKMNARLIKVHELNYLN